MLESHSRHSETTVLAKKVLGIWPHAHPAHDYPGYVRPHPGQASVFPTVTVL